VVEELTGKRHGCENCTTCNERIPFFDLLTEEELEIINRDRYSVRFKEDELILKQGVTATHIITLTSGIGKVYIEGANNRNLLLRLVKPWIIIDEPGVHTNKKNQFSVAALTPCEVCFIEASNFNEVLGLNSRFACEVINHRSQHSMFCLDRMVSLTQKQMLGRMADGLLYLSKTIYETDDFELNLSRQDLADLTAMSKDSAIRMIKELEKDGIVHLNGSRMHIAKMASLEQISATG
jgi:CRP/FNR family transcriptional regulator